MGLQTLILGFLVSGVFNTGTGQQEATAIDIHNDRVRVVIEQRGTRAVERYYARKGNEWVLLLESGSGLRPDPSLRANGSRQDIHFARVSELPSTRNEQTVMLDGNAGPFTLRKIIALRNTEPFVRIDVLTRVDRKVSLTHVLSTYSFVPEGKHYPEAGVPEFLYTPQLRPEPEHVIADHTFRSPALMMQNGGYFAALVPDLFTIAQKHRPLRTIADFQVKTADAPFMSFGLQNWVQEPYRLRNSHVYYTAPDSLSAELENTSVAYGFYLFLDAQAPPRIAYQRVVRFLWEEYGRRNVLEPKGPQAEPFSSYIKKAWYEFVPKVALETEYRGVPVTLLRQARLAWSNKLPKEADNDAWFNVWFNSLRTAYGMYLHGMRVGDRRLQAQARGVVNLALLAPQNKGMAPSIFYVDSAGGHWVGDQAWGGISNGEYLSMFHNAWTNYWLLQWADLLPARKTDLENYVRAFADFLVARQQPSGVLSSWYHPETLVPAEQLRDENAETAGAALLLAELFARTKEERYLAASERAMQYVFKNILPEQKWFDYETFFSCSRKPLGFFDSYTQQHPQNTLSMQQAAEACYELFRLTKNDLYRVKGAEIMDYLSLYQQVWSPAWLSCELFGGFGVQNTDGEWSDSRQGYFAVTFMNYYELTGEREYFERGVAALRAMFSLFESPESPRTAENYAHSALDQLAGVTGLHWGTGSSVVSIHLITARYGDAYVNVQQGWGVGIDGCRIPEVRVNGNRMEVTLLDNVSTPRPIQMKFDKMDDTQYEVIVNGVSYGKKMRDELSKGLAIGL